MILTVNGSAPTLPHTPSLPCLGLTLLFFQVVPAHGKLTQTDYTKIKTYFHCFPPRLVL